MLDISLNITIWIGVLVTFVLGFLVYIRNPKNSINKTLALWSLTLALWSIGLFFYEHPFFFTSETWLRYVYLVVLGILGAFFYFSFIFPQKFEHRSISMLFYWLPAVFFAYTIIFTKVFLTEVVQETWGPHQTLGPLYPTFGVWAPILSIWSLYNLTRSYKRAKGLAKLQIKYVFLSLFFLSLSPIILDIIFPVLLKNSRFIWFSPISSSAFAGLTAYAIVKHRLMDIRLVVARSVSYSLLLLILGTFYVSSIFLISTFVLPAAMNGSQLAISIILALIIAFTFQPLRRWLERVTDRIFFKEKYDPEDLLTDLGRIMASTLDLKKLAQEVLKKVLGEMKISRGALVLVKNHQPLRIESYSYQKEPQFEPDQIGSLMRANTQALVFEELPEGKIKNLMRRLDLTFSVSLEVKKGKIGLLVLGEKSSGDIYTNDDIEILEILAPQLAVAVQNAEAYDEIQRFSLTLKEKVKQATEELRTANIKLKELDALKDEFVSVASHELRTPMTSIKNYVWMLLHGKGGKISKKQHLYLDRVAVSTERLIHMVNDMLTISRIERGKIEVKVSPGDVVKLAQEIVEELKGKAEEKKIKLSFTAPKKKMPSVLLDKDRIREVLFNLIGNAIKFTEVKGKVTVSFAKKDRMVSTIVTDTGRGIAKKDIPRLFKKFGRLDRSFAIMAETKGTGLGLYICEQIIDLHRGEIGVKSKLGEGSIFYFDLRMARR